MASTVSQCTRDTIYIRDSRYVVPCVCERTSKLNVGNQVIKLFTVGLVWKLLLPARITIYWPR